MAILLEQIGAELSVVRANAWQCEWNRSIHFCRTELISSGASYEPSSDDDLLHDVLLKGMRRGTRPFVSRFAENNEPRKYEPDETDVPSEPTGIALPSSEWTTGTPRPQKARDAMIVSMITILQRTAQMILQRRWAIGWDAYTRAGFARSDRGNEP